MLQRVGFSDGFFFFYICRVDYIKSELVYLDSLAGSPVRLVERNVAVTNSTMINNSDCVKLQAICRVKIQSRSSR